MAGTLGQEHNDGNSGLQKYKGTDAPDVIPTLRTRLDSIQRFALRQDHQRTPTYMPEPPQPFSPNLRLLPQQCGLQPLPLQPSRCC